VADRVATCPECEAEFEGGWAFARLGTHRKKEHGVMPGGKEAPTVTDPAGAGDLPQETGTGAGDQLFPDSQAPPERKPGKSEKPAPERGTIRNLFAKKAKEPQAKTTERKPRLTFRRQSTAPLFEFVWGQAGQGLMMTGVDVPVGRVLTLQAPMVGDVLDEAIKGTAVDKIIQPFVRQGDRAKLIAAVVLPPLCVGLIERNPELAEPLAPVLRAVMMPMLVELAASLKKAKAQEQKMVEALADLGELFPQELLAEAKKRGQSPVDLIIESFFAPSPQPQNNGSAPAAEPAVA
jgi:hypothetical protein